MQRQKLLRKTLSANTNTNFNFDVRGAKFFVKNYTSNIIYVSLGDELTQESAVKIESGFAQIVTANDNTSLENTTNIVTVLSEVGGEVEVQCLKW